MCISIPPAMVCAIETMNEKNYQTPIRIQIQTQTLERGRGREQQQQQQQQRRVRFSSVMGIVVPLSNLTEEENHRVWYTSSELVMMKNEVRALSRKIRDDHLYQHGGVLRTIHTPTPTISNRTSFNDCTANTRGLELRLCKNRQMNKSLAIWGTLKAQNRNNDPQFIAMISQKCTAVAKELAISVAVRDYCELYNPDAIPLLLPNIKEIALCPFPVKLKRKRSTTTTTTTMMTLENIENNNGRRISHVQTTRNVRLRTF
jgi:hypothetical protein